MTNDPLRRLRVARPCDQTWEAMHGDDRRRFCDRCQRDVVNLADMTRAEAERFVAENIGRACVRLERLPTSPIRRGVAQAALALSLAACARTSSESAGASAPDAGTSATIAKSSAPAPASAPSDAGSIFALDPLQGTIDAAAYGGGIGLLSVGSEDGGGIKLKAGK